MQTIGERLEEARKRKGISIREASEATKIRSDYLAKFESNTFELNLPDIYVRGFLRTYGAFLKLNTEKLLTDYASLGLGSSREARRETREVFGRLDLQEAPKPVTGSEAAAARETPPAPAPRAAAASSAQSTLGVPAPSFDRSQWIKGGLIVAALAVAIALLVVVINMLTRSTPAGTTNLNPSTPAVAAAPAESPANSVTLIAIDNVRVTVTQIADNRVLFSGDLLRGERKTFTREGRVRVSYNLGRNLQVEQGGKLFRMSAPGEGRNTID